MTRLTRLAFPLPGGPVTAINVPGLSLIQLKTCFSAAILSCHAPLPTPSLEAEVSADDDPKENPEGRTNFALTHLTNE